jgi:hypothetical protein
LGLLRFIAAFSHGQAIARLGPDSEIHHEHIHDNQQTKAAMNRRTPTQPQTMKSAFLLACFFATAALHAAAPPMFDPVIDRPDQEWCYAANSTTVIGLPFVPEPVQVTYDGAIYTRYAELDFFHGDPLTPVMARNKTFLDGWIPAVEYGWKDKGIDYHLEIFSFELPELGRANLVQFAKLSMKNNGADPADGTVAAAVRSSSEFYRNGKPKTPVTPATQFDLQNDRLLRDGKLVYFFSPRAETLAVPGSPKSGTYRAGAYQITDRAATGFAVWKRTLKPGESFEAILKMPRIPVTDPKQIAAVEAADYAGTREKMVKWWHDLFGDFSIHIPEQRVQDSYYAGLVHLMLATRARPDGSGKRQGSGLPYDALFLNDYFDMVQAYDTAGLFRFAEPNVDWLLSKQYKTGMFIDVHNRGNDDIVTSHGQGLYELAYHLVMTRDTAYGKKVYPAIRKGADLVVDDHYHNNKHGLIRGSIPYDAPMVNGSITAHNLFALLALRTSIRAARIMGHKDDAARWTKAEKSYSKAILKALDQSMKKYGYIRSGLYDWNAGWVQGRKGCVNKYPGQDWENTLLAYPTELLGPKDERLTKTLETIRKRRYREGVMTYRNGMHIHQYVTCNNAQQYRTIGDQKHALLDLYHIILHNGSTHEGFENLVTPWSDRTPAAGCPPPHAWAAAKISLFIRDMLVCEHGGEAGLNEGKRGLDLFSLVSPAWMKPGKEVSIRNVPIEMGKISATLRFTGDGAALTVDPAFRTPPHYISFRIPYTVKLESFESDAKHSRAKDGVVFFSPDLTRATFKWTPRPGANDGNFQDILRAYRSEYGFVEDGDYEKAKPGKPFLLDDEKAHSPEPPSFDLVRRAFLKEYKRRFEEYVKAGNKPYLVEPPKLLTAAERKAAYDKLFDSAEIGIAVGKPATASASAPDHAPALAVDGNARDLASSWQTDPYPAWWQVDLEKPVKIDRIQVFPYWGAKRYYQYTVEVSKDGKSWRRVGDMTKNTRPATPKGDEFRFDPVTARYIRVNVLHHSLNRGVHIVEVRVFRSGNS